MQGNEKDVSEMNLEFTLISFITYVSTLLSATDYAGNTPHNEDDSPGQCHTVLRTLS